MPGGQRTEKENDNDNNCSYLVEDVNQQMLSLGTKPFAILTDALFKVDADF